MSRLLTTGFETGDISEAGSSTTGTGGSLSLVSATPTPRTGSYCLKAAATAASWNATYKQLPLSAPKTEVWIRFAFFSHMVPGAEITIAQLLTSIATTQGSLRYTPSDGLLRVYTGALIATASTPFAQDGWHVIEWRTQLLTTTTGNSEVWLDGTRVINFSGDNSASTTLDVLQVLLGHVGGAVSSATGSYLGFDDLAVNDVAGSANNGRPGDGRVVLLVPNGAGSATTLTRGGTDTGANYSQTSELPASMTQYVVSATATDRDLYAMSDLGVSATSINVVEEIALAQNSDAGAGSLGLTIKSGSTINEATAQTLAASAAYKVARWETDPDTSAAWTVSALNALEAGITIR